MLKEGDLVGPEGRLQLKLWRVEAYGPQDKAAEHVQQSKEEEYQQGQSRTDFRFKKNAEGRCN